MARHYLSVSYPMDIQELNIEKKKSQKKTAVYKIPTGINFKST